jgi:hypothetical protein
VSVDPRDADPQDFTVYPGTTTVTPGSTGGGTVIVTPGGDDGSTIVIPGKE